MRLGAALAAVAVGALALAGSAAGHVTVVPPFVDANARTTISFNTPNERRGRATTSLTIDAPPGFELSSAAAPAGWVLELSGGTARWTGGRIEGEQTVTFPLVVTARTRAGVETFRAVQGYNDGEVVRWSADVTVLPAAAEEAPPQHLRRALTAGAVGLAVIAASFLVLRRLRRRPLQER
jgi:uncharacterized protein YcnI